MKRTYVVLGLLVALVAGLGVWITTTPIVKESVFTFSYTETLPQQAKDYVYFAGDAKVDVSYDAALIGEEQQVTVSWNDKEITVSLLLVDDVAPVITFTSQDLVLLYEKTIDELVQVEDVSETSVSVNQELSTLASGTQTLCVHAIDSYGNEQEVCEDKTIVLKEETLGWDYYQPLETLVSAFAQAKGIASNQLGLFYVHTQSQEEVLIQGDLAMQAASTIKVPLNMLYYDAIAKGERRLSDTIMYTAYADTGEDYNTSYYIPGAKVPLEYLLSQSIQISDNVATNVLMMDLGSFTRYRTMLQDYADVSYPAGFLSQNLLTPHYMMEVMKHLYANQTVYADLIDDMLHTTQQSYFKAYVDEVDIAHKYGDYAGYNHDIGIIYTEEPFLLGIFTYDIDEAHLLIGELCQLVYEYHLYHPLIAS
ncbi:MAG: serine hydrolase [Erysipelotrichaceae bacterium]